MKTTKLIPRKGAFPGFKGTRPAVKPSIYAQVRAGVITAESVLYAPINQAFPIRAYGRVK